MAKKTIEGNLGIPKPKKQTKGPDIDFSTNLQTDFYTLDELEKAQIGLKSLKDPIKTKKSK